LPTDPGGGTIRINLAVTFANPVPSEIINSPAKTRRKIAVETQISRRPDCNLKHAKLELFQSEMRWSREQRQQPRIILKSMR
jgi:hypothetical protein